MITEKTNLPEHLCRPEGFLGDVVNHLERIAEYVCLEFFLAAALCLESVITGRKVQDYRGTRTNLFAICIGPSGVGKDLPRKLNRELLDGTQLEGPEKFFSGTGVSAALEQNPALLCQPDEVGIFLRSACSEQAKTSGNGVAAAMMTAYSSADTIWTPDGYANADRSISVNQPHLVMYGSTTGPVLYEALSGGEAANGFAGRIQFFLSPNGNYARYKDADRVPVPEAIQSFIDDWNQRAFGPEDLSFQNPDPAVIDINSEAKERIRGHIIGISDRKNGESETAAAIWSRAPEKTSKLALLHAISRRSEIIEVQDVDYAVAVTNLLTRRLIVLLDGNIATTKHEADVQRLVKEIKGLGGLVSMSQIGSKARWISKKDRNAIMNQLIECGDLIQVYRVSKGRPAHGVAVSMDRVRNTSWIPVTADLIEQSKQLKI